MRIGVVVGICVEQDAISSAACAQAAVLLETPGVTSVDLFTTHLRRPTKCMAHEVAGPWQLLSDPAFRSCDVLIFHWGIFTPLFDAVWSIDFGRQRVAVHFHNVTSPHLVDESRREVIHQSLRQIEALNALPIEIWTFSEFNRRTLVSIGIDGDRIQFVPFPIESPRPVRRTVRTDAVRLLCVGRIVPAKGTDTLIEALGILRLRGGSNYRLWVAGNRSMSSPDYADALNERVEELGLAGSVFFANPDDDGLWSLLESSDIVVSPSLHEGLCVPIIEGYLAGCHAVGTTETNLPFVVQRPDPIVPPNDPVALADAIETLVSELDDPSRRWLRNVEQLCSQFSNAHVSRRMSHALRLPVIDRSVMSLVDGHVTPILQPWIDALPDSVMRERERSTLNRLPDLGDWEPGNRFTDILRELGQPVTIHRKAWEYGLCLQGLEQLGCLRPDATAIAVGAGTEPPLYYLANAIARVVATDLYDNPEHEGTPAMLTDTSFFAPFAYRKEHLEVYRMSGDDLRFGDAEFDIAFSLSSIEHFGSRETQRAAFDEMVRVVKPGGVICIMTELILTSHRHHEYFQWSEIDEIFLSHPSVELVGGDVDLTISESLVRYPVDMGRSGATGRSPHIVLMLDGMEWTSLSLFFRRM